MRLKFVYHLKKLIYLFIYCSYLRWQETGRNEGISIPWQSITLHAISNTPVKCIYIMLDLRIDYPAVGNNGNGRANDRPNGNGHPDEDDDDEGTCEGKNSFLSKNTLNVFQTF